MYSSLLSSSLLALLIAFEENCEAKSQSVVQACSEFQEALDTLLLVYRGCVCRKNKCKAQDCWNSLDLQAFEEILALLIYGMVLFPNPDQLIDVNVVKIFMSRNPVPTLLGDILHSLHACTLKRRGTLLCCIPLLARWFISTYPRLY